MEDSLRKTNFNYSLFLLIVCAILLLARMIYVFVSEPQRFPVNTIKISTSFEHISRSQIESILDNYNNTSFLLLPLNKLKADLSSLSWVQDIQVQKVWPDTLKITIIEKKPVAFWKKNFLMNDGMLIPVMENDINKQNQVRLLPKLIGPDNEQQQVLHNFQKLSRILSEYDLRMDSLRLRDDLSWDLILAGGTILRLGKKDIEKRVLSFCKVYSSNFADKADKLASVDLRYAHGMAVQWNGSNK